MLEMFAFRDLFALSSTNIIKHAYTKVENKKRNFLTFYRLNACHAKHQNSSSSTDIMYANVYVS